MTKLVYGVGVNDSDYVTDIREELGYVEGKRKRKQVWRCPFYEAWTSMLNRCFSEKEKARHPTYKDVTCCEEWLVFSNFKQWMETQDWEGKQLDKDILVPDNKIYSSETCAFVYSVTNKFVTASDATRGEWPIGVYWHRQTKKFVAQCKNPFTKNRGYLGLFNCPREAHETWRKRKHELAQLVAELESDPRVKEALKNRYSFDVWYASCGETNGEEA